jgi:ribosome maturation factor RimP
LNGISQLTVRIFDLVEPILLDMGFELIDVEYLSLDGRWILRLYIDKEGGVAIDDCVRVSHELEDLIEVKDIINHEYVLEVSSPGLNRPLKREKDYLRVIGENIRVRSVKPIEGQRNFTGRLRGFHEGTICLETESRVIELPLDEVEKSNLVYDFNNSLN